MSFSNVADALGFNSYPPSWDEIYASIQGEPHPCSRELIESLQEKYQLFGNHYPAVLAGWEDTLKKPEYLAFIHTAVRHMERENGSITSIRKFPTYVTDGTPAGDMALLFVHLPRVERGMQLYLDCGFTKEKVREYFHCLEGGMNVFRNSNDRSGLNQLYFGWTSHYIDCRLFNHEGFNYEMKLFPQDLFVLRNKETREVVIVIGNKTIHRSGRILGTADFEEEEGSFTTSITETEEEMIAHPVRNLLVAREPERFSFREWEVLLRPDDEVLGIHIPRGTDLSPEHVAFANASALEFVRHHFENFHPKAFHCSSWLLEPAMEEILGRPGKISGFGNLFYRYPNKSKGREVFSFVFGPKSSKMPYEELPETTSLHRALKKIYCEGKHIHAWGGVILLD